MFGVGLGGFSTYLFAWLGSVDVAAVFLCFGGALVASGAWGLYSTIGHHKGLLAAFSACSAVLSIPTGAVAVLLLIGGERGRALAWRALAAGGSLSSAALGRWESAHGCCGFTGPKDAPVTTACRVGAQTGLSANVSSGCALSLGELLDARSIDGGALVATLFAALMVSTLCAAFLVVVRRRSVLNRRRIRRHSYLHQQTRAALKLQRSVRGRLGRVRAHRMREFWRTRTILNATTFGRLGGSSVLVHVVLGTTEACLAALILQLLLVFPAEVLDAWLTSMAIATVVDFFIVQCVLTAVRLWWRG